MPFTVNHVNRAVVLSIQGDLDAFEVQNIRPDLEKLLRGRPTALILDLLQVPMIDSSGIGLLVYSFKLCSGQSVRFGMCNVSGQPAEMIRFLKIDQRIPLFPDLQTALTG